MKSTETADRAYPFHGDKPYQRQARAALPLLVRQANAAEPISYRSLVTELGMPNPRNLGYVLGSVGNTLKKVAKEWDEPVPPIQCLVVTQADGLPGKGIGPFIGGKDYKRLSKQQRQARVDEYLAKIYTYPYWDEVLQHLSLKPVTSDFTELVTKAKAAGRRGGESEEHKKLKAWVAANPHLIGLPRSMGKGVTELPLPSGDSLDVSFRKGRQWIAVEVKSKISPDGDLARGLFQCVKYQSVMEAELRSKGQRGEVRAILVSARRLSAELVGLKNLLGVEVFETEASLRPMPHIK